MYYIDIKTVKPVIHTIYWGPLLTYCIHGWVFHLTDQAQLLEVPKFLLGPVNGHLPLDGVLDQRSLGQEARVRVAAHPGRGRDGQRVHGRDHLVNLRGKGMVG